MSYLRSVHLQKDKTIFDVTKLPAEAYAASLGLPGVPKIKFLSREQARVKKNASRDVAKVQAAKDSDDDEDEDAESDAGEESSDEGEGEEPTGADKPAVPNTATRVRPLPSLPQHSTDLLILL